MNQPQVVQLPDSLRGQFSALEKRMFRIETVRAAGVAASGLGVSFLAVFAGDRIADLSTWMRAGSLGLGAGVAGVALVPWAARWFFGGRPGHSDLARVVQGKFRILGDRLLGIVELADEKKRPTYFSEELYRAAIHQVAAEAGKFDFTQSVDPAAARSATKLASLVLGSSVMACLLFPAVAGNVLARWALPFAKVQRATLVEIEMAAPNVIPAHGEGFVVDGTVKYRSFWRPGSMKAEYQGVRVAIQPVKEGRFTFSIPGQTTASALNLRLGDATATVSVRPEHRPALTGLDATVAPPSYLGHPQAVESAQAGVLSVVDGSQASFRGTVSRSLGAVSSEADGKPLSTVLSSNLFTTVPLALDGVPEVSFQWKDQLNLTNSSPFRLRIETRKDQAPLAEFPELSRDTAILETEVLAVVAAARDDFGVNTLSLKWQREDESADSTNRSTQPFESKPGDKLHREYQKSFSFAPSTLGLKPDTTVYLRALATDYLPGREASETPVYRLHVLGKEQHAEMIRQRLDSLLTGLEEVSRSEEKLAGQTEALRQMDSKADTEPASQESARKASELAEAQKQNAEALQELAKKGMETLREALRNPAFKEDQLAEWTKNLSEMQKLAQKDMKEAAKDLQAASDSKADRQDKLKQGEEKERDAMQALEQLQKKINKDLDDLQAMTMAERLRKVGSDELDTSAGLQKGLKESVGLSVKELSPRLRRANTFLADRQAMLASRAEELRKEISRYNERTGKQIYGDVSQQMSEARIVEELDSIRALISDNVGMRASDALVEWSERFSKWAALLEPKPQDSGGQEGGGEGGDKKDDGMKQLMALLRMRETQSTLKERTRILDSEAPGTELRNEAVGGLMVDQQVQTVSLEKLQKEKAAPVLSLTLREAHQSMEQLEVAFATRQLGGQVLKTHDETIQTLSDAINILNEDQKKDKGSSSKDQQQDKEGDEMQFLMKMMAQQQGAGMTMGPGSAPGGNPGQGGTGDPGQGAPGGTTGGAVESRNINRAGGAGGGLPAEFREAIETYFREVEKEAR